MATKVQKLTGWICSDCRTVISESDIQYNRCPDCGELFDDASCPLSASNKTINLPQTKVKYYG